MMKPGKEVHIFVAFPLLYVYNRRIYYFHKDADPPTGPARRTAGLKTQTLLIYLSLCIVLSAALACVPVLLRRGASGPAPVQPPAAAQADPSSSPLFPDVNTDSIDTLFVTAADRSFTFTRTGRQVSVNGSNADRDVFSTLLRQIVNMPVTEARPFSPGRLLMTIRMEAGDMRHDVRFYETPDEEHVDVAYAVQAAQHYGVTDAWRLGTLLLACDGTRILDEQGLESPAVGYPDAAGQKENQ